MSIALHHTNDDNYISVRYAIRETSAKRSLRQYRLSRSIRTTPAVFGAVLIFTAPLSVDYLFIISKISGFVNSF